LNPSIEKKIVAGFGVAILVLVLLAAAIVWNAARFGGMFRRVDHAHAVLERLELVVECVLKMQSSTRGFVITGSADALTPYFKSKDSAGAAVRTLRKQTADNPVQQAFIRSLEPALAEMTRIMDARAVSRRALGPEAGRDANEFLTSQAAVERVLKIVRAMEQHERQLLTQRSTHAQSAALTTIGVSTVTSGLAIAFLIGSGWLVRRDFRQRVRSEAALRKSEQMFQRLFDNAPDAIVQVDRTGRIVRANKQTETVFGWPPGTLAGRPVDQLLPQRFHARHSGYLTAYFAQPHTRLLNAGLQLVGRRKDDGEFPVEIMLSPIETDEGLQVLAVIRNVTERRAAEEKIRRLNLDLQLQNARLEMANNELESFSYSVSHDLRAPLRHIDGFANLLAKHAGAALDEKSQRFLSVISDASRRMGRLIDDLLTFSRTGRAPLSLGKLDHDLTVRGVIREGGLDRDERITWNIGPLPVTQADAPMMRQVWANLIENAVKYSSRAVAPRIEIGTLSAGPDMNETIFFVRDNGVGFDMKYASKLFGVFQRLHSEAEFQGTGIGLANVRRIIARHGGRTWAEGAPGIGATFYFSLPVRPA
jgi:PAS domain S-box-containing protein